MPFHIDETEVVATIRRLEQSISGSLHADSVVGVQARLQQAALRPVYIAMVRELNAGCAPADLSRALAGLMSNFILTVADTISNKREPERATEISRLLLYIGVAVKMQLDAGVPSEFARTVSGGHA